VLALAALVVLAACEPAGLGYRPGAATGLHPGPDPTTTTVPRATPARVLAAGDVADCRSPGDEATAAVLDRHGGTVLVLGDAVYESGSHQEFAECYQPTWGRHLHRTRAVPGNHEYHTPGAAGFFDYFGAAAGAPGSGWFSFDLGAWHVVGLNSNCKVVSCAAGSAQHRWLVADLAASGAACTLAFMHHPRFSSGPHGGTTAVAPLFTALHAAGADVVLAGHDHHYERTHPVDGITYVVSGGGCKTTRVGRSTFTAAATSALQFLLIDIDDDRLAGHCIGVGGATIDRFHLRAREHR
jgi:3',5'-cyclic AMP phosphodiesterase CpdA